MRVNFKKLRYNAVLPKYANFGDAGLDLIVTNIDYTEKYISYGFGIAIEIPDGYVGLIFPRSSISKYDLSLCNCVGVIDSGYRNEISARFRRLGTGETIYKIGDKACQLIIIPIPRIESEFVENLSDSDRGINGYGSTGN